MTQEVVKGYLDPETGEIVEGEEANGTPQELSEEESAAAALAETETAPQQTEEEKLAAEEAAAAAVPEKTEKELAEEASIAAAEESDKVTAEFETLSKYLGFDIKDSNSVDKVKSILAASSSLDEDRAKLDILTQQTENPFVNDTVRDLNNFIKATGIDNPQLFHRVSNVKEGELTDIQAIVFAETLKDPSTLAKEGVLTRITEKKYSTELADDEGDKEMIEFGLERDGRAARAEIKAFKEKIPESSPSTSKEVIEKHNDNIKTWSENVDTISSLDNSIVVTSKGSDDKDVEALNYIITEEDIKPYINGVVESYTSQGKPYTPELAQEARNIAQGFYLKDNIDKIAKASYAKGIGDQKLAMIVDVNNPSEGGAETKPVKKSTDSAEANLEKVTNEMLEGR